MSRLYHTGFEWRSVTAGVEFDTVSGTPSINTTTKHGGGASFEVSGSIAASSFEGASHTLPQGNQTVIYARQYMYVQSIPSDGGASVATFDFMQAGTSVASVQLYHNGTDLSGIVYWNNFADSQALTGTFALGAQLRVELYYDSTPANGSELLTVRIDGVAVATITNANFTTKTINQIQWGVYNGNVGAITTEVVLFDDVAVNNGSGSINNSWPGEGYIVAAVPSAAGDNAATTGVFSYINEIPPSDTATSGSTMIELDSNTNVADYNMTDTSTLGVGSADTINAVAVLARVREEAAGTSSYQLRIKSASGGTVTSTTAADAGNATARTNPNGTTAFGRPLISETDPTTGVAWTPTGTNSIDNMQIGATNVDADSTPDLWILTMAAMIDYTPVGGIAGVDASWAFAADAATISQNHLLTPNDASWGFTADAATFNDSTTPVDAGWAFTADSTTVVQNHTIAPNDASWAFGADAGQVAPDLTPVDASWAFTADQTTIEIVRKPPTAYARYTKPTTAYDRGSKATAAYAREAKPTVAYVKPSKPTVPFTRVTKPLTEYF